MAVDIQSEEGRILRRLIPLSTLSVNKFAALCAQLTVEHAEEGQFLFRRGDADSHLFYLLDGTVGLQTDTLKIEVVKAGSESARFAIAHQIPRKVDAVAYSRIQFLRLDADMMKSVQEAVYEENESTMMVEELEDNDDWMTTLLKSPIFRGLPPANLQKILISLEEISFKAGEVILNQGDEGDYYYVIKKGQALLSRKPTPHAKDVKLGQLGDLDTFGEDALISGEPRSVSVIALTDIDLLRLNKQQFITLIKLPTLKYITYQQTQEYIANGADVIDVRGPDEYSKNHLQHSISVPFFSLRMYLKTLNRHHPIVVVCKDGKTSEKAAFILLQHKFNALILKGGIDGVSTVELKAPASFQIDDGVETGILTEPVSQTPPADGNVSDSTAIDPQQLIQQLSEKCKALEAENATLEVRCSTLSRQLEALKSELESIRKGAS